MEARVPAGPWRLPRLHSVAPAQLLAFLAMLLAAGALLTAGTMMVPVRAAVLPPAFRTRYMDVAIAGACFVVVAVSLYLYAVHRWGRRFAARDDRRLAAQASGASSSTRRLAPLAVLRPEVVPTHLIAVTGIVAVALVIGAWVMLLPPWAVVVTALIPWIPMLFAEGVRKYRHYGLYALFGAITLLQIGHLGEHTVQVIQVFVFNGDLSRAHGVFGQLDFETVHFVWDTLVWIGLGALVLRFGSTNGWLWVSLAAASVHEIEHIYLFTVYRMDYAFYTDGGFAGIMGFGGLIGSPLARPYLHFAYNVCVIVPLLFAFWQQTKQVYARSGLNAPRSLERARHDQPLAVAEG